jgi:hypothetical protein
VICATNMDIKIYMYVDRCIQGVIREEILKDSIQTCIYHTEVSGCTYEQARTTHYLKDNIRQRHNILMYKVDM